MNQEMGQFFCYLCTSYFGQVALGWNFSIIIRHPKKWMSSIHFDNSWSSFLLDSTWTKYSLNDLASMRMKFYPQQRQSNLQRTPWACGGACKRCLFWFAVANWASGCCWLALSTLGWQRWLQILQQVRTT